jgi:BirA family transcriptional regulator, biotin operon repressor / biotin---[acetyl-CoA-carboxylase] ligase
LQRVLPHHCIKLIKPIQILHYNTIDSTNTEARRLYEQGERGPIWIVADEQKAGRGRMGRIWHSEPGNLYSTLLLPCAAPQTKMAQISFVAGLAVHDVATTFIKNASISLKWPNDCLIDGAKFCGILSEVIAPNQIALGIGMNIAHAPKDTPYAATHLKGATVKAAHEVLSASLLNWVKIWNNAQDFGSIKFAWESKALNLGKTVSVDTGRAIRQGIFKGLDDDGAMILLQSDNTEITIHAGDVRVQLIKENPTA